MSQACKLLGYSRDSFYRFQELYDQGGELALQDLDAWMAEYNTVRIHSGKYCYGKTPMQTFLESKHLSHEKMLDISPAPPPPIVAVG